MRLFEELLEHLKIKKLYPPQKEAIAVVEKGESVLVSVPTAAGKTLVAYAGLMKAVLEKGGHFDGINRKVQIKPLKWVVDEGVPVITQAQVV